MSKITLDNEYRAIENLLETNFSTLKVLSHNPPEISVKGTTLPNGTISNTNDVVFELIDSSTEEVNRAMTRKLRTYQLLFYFDKRVMAMDYLSKVDSLIEETSSIPCLDRYIKVHNHTMSRIFTTSSGKHAFYCLIEASYHSHRNFTQAPKMQGITHVMNGIETNIN